MSEPTPHTDLPPGWVPIPHAIHAADAPAIAHDLLRSAAIKFPGLEVTDDAIAQTTAAITRLPVEEDTVARLWHLLGPGATGLTADLSIRAVAEGVELDAYVAGPFDAVQVQRRIPFNKGLATFSFVAPDAQSLPLILLRVQRIDGERHLIVDVLDSDFGLLGQVLSDVIQLVGLSQMTR